MNASSFECKKFRGNVTSKWTCTRPNQTVSSHFTHQILFTQNSVSCFSSLLITKTFFLLTKKVHSYMHPHYLKFAFFCSHILLWFLLFRFLYFLLFFIPFVSYFKSNFFATFQLIFVRHLHLQKSTSNQTSLLFLHSKTYFLLKNK